MLTLGIETSGRDGSVALVDGSRALGDASLSQTGRRHARTLVSESKSLLERCGCLPSKIEVVAVSIGPGSFTGLRVGVVCAKAFAYATASRIVAVDTLQAIAANSPPGAERVDIVMDAFRGELFLGRYHRSANDQWERQGEIQLVPADAASSWIDVDVPLSGPGLSVLNDPSIRSLPESCWVPQAAQVAKLGEQRALAGLVDDVWTLEPLYVRKSAAEERLAGH